MPIHSDGLDGYEVQDIIGRGGFATVYRAFDTKHKRDVAIKVINGSLAEDERRRFDREREAIGRLANHPNVVPVFDSGYSEDGEAYLVLEFEGGGCLTDQLQANGRLDWPTAVEIVGAVSSAVAVAHGHGIRHRDIKPENILLDEYGIAKLTDFGIASVSTNATTAGVASATLAHCAPETLDGAKATDAVDVYSLASTFHQLVAGTPAFVRPNEEGLGALVRRVLVDEPPSLLPYEVPASIDAVIKRSMAKNPADRPATAAEFRRLLVEASGAASVADSAVTESTRPDSDLGGQTIAVPDSVLPVSSVSDEIPSAKAGATPNPSAVTPPPGSVTPGPGMIPAAITKQPQEPAPQQMSPPPVVAAPVAAVSSPTPQAKPPNRLLFLLPLVVVLMVGAGALYLLLRNGSGATDPQTTVAASVESAPSSERPDQTVSASTATTTLTSPSSVEATTASDADDRTESTSTPTRPETSAGPAPQLFQSPSGNIHCFLASTSASCEIGEKDWNAPALACELDYGNTVYVNSEGVGFVCAGDTLFGPKSTLEYGSTLTVGDYSCISETSGVTCWNGAGIGFVVARAAYEFLGVEASDPLETLGAASCSAGGSIVFGGSTTKGFDVLLCATGSGGLEYHGVERPTGLEIRLVACQVSDGVWEADNAGYRYVVDSAGTPATTSLLVLDPAGEEILFDTFTSVVGNTAYDSSFAC